MSAPGLGRRSPDSICGLWGLASLPGAKEPMQTYCNEDKGHAGGHRYVGNVGVYPLSGIEGRDD